MSGTCLVSLVCHISYRGLCEHDLPLQPRPTYLKSACWNSRTRAPLAYSRISFCLAAWAREEWGASHYRVLWNVECRALLENGKCGFKLPSLGHRVKTKGNFAMATILSKGWFHLLFRCLFSVCYSESHMEAGFFVKPVWVWILHSLSCSDQIFTVCGITGFDTCLWRTLVFMT